MLMFSGTLLDVQTGEYNTLVFESKRYDVGLGREVECSESIGIQKECLDFVPNYKKHIGENIMIGVSGLRTKKGGIFYMSSTDVIDLEMLLMS